MFDTEFKGEKIGYARTSREDQRLDLQIDALIKYGVKDKFIHKEKVSALSKKRPQFDLAIKRCRKGDMLVIWKLDRLGRTLKQLTETVEALNKRGVEVKSLTEEINTSTAIGKVFFQFMAIMAEFERNNIGERTAAGLQAAKKRGTWRSRPVTFTESQWDKMVQSYIKNPAHGVRACADAAGVTYQTAYRYMEDIKAQTPFDIRFPTEVANGRKNNENQ